MTKQESFISTIAPFIQKYAQQYNIGVCSPIIAQSVLESASGTSELALNACNYFGLKYRPGRCPTASGIYYKNGSEQNSDGSYSTSAMQWMKFENMESCVNGYFDFINISNYANLKNINDPKQYLENIKADGYATSLKYVDNLMNVIEKYELTQFDKELTMEKIIAIDAGHGIKTLGKRCMKSLDPCQTREWYLNDRIADCLQQLLAQYNCTAIRVDDTTGTKDIPLSTRVKTANDLKANVYISIHHNAGLNGRQGGGTTVYYCSGKTERLSQAKKLYNSIIAKTRLIGNRSSTVINKGFYVIKNTKMPAFLIENGYMDSPTDIPIILSQAHTENTAQGILNFLVTEFSLTKKNDVTQNNSNPNSASVNYSFVFDYKYYADKYLDLKKAFGYNETSLFNHFISNGMKEGRQAISTFNVYTYQSNYADLRSAFGNDLPSYYKHYCTNGKAENRKAV